MRKRLFIFAAATCFALSAFATPAFAEEPSLPDEPTSSSEALVQSDENSDENSNENSDGNSNENSDGNSNGNSNENSDGNVKEDAPPSGNDDALSYSDEGQANAGVTTPVVAKIGNTGYTTLQEAINKAKSGDVITLQDDLTLNDEGLRFDGPKVSTPAEWKDITLDAAKHSLTLNDKGIYAAYCKVTIMNCPALTVKAGTNTGNTDGETSKISAVLFCPGTLVLNECKTVNITNPEPETGGSGLCIYNGGDLYIKNNTHFTVSGFMNPGPAGKDGCSGIYIDSDPDQNDEYTTNKGRIDVSDHSTLIATNCYHNGITANPIDIFVSDHSTIDVNNNNKGRYGKGGLGCYYGKLTILDHSHVTAYKNTAWGFAIFVKDLEVDGTSEIDAVDNGSYWIYPNGGLTWAGNGISIAGNGVLHNGATMSASGNWGPGVSTHIDVNRGFMGGSLTVENGATLTSTKNYNYGLANGKTLNINTGAHVYLSENYSGGLDNYPAATTTVDEKADLVITNNYGVGINNGNNTTTDADGHPFTANAANVATLILKSGTITKNHANIEMPSPTIPQLPQLHAWADCGAGVCNRYGNVDISIDTKIYNNHADIAGDDLYNYKNDGAAVSNNFTITVVPGAKWSVLDVDGKIIDDWYHDDEGEENRWKETSARNNTDTVLPQGAALKAAHGINAPTPSPKPVEPTAAPTEAPTPTAVPTTVPTAAPTAAPTTAPADNTATAAPATPAPTAQPTVPATPAPTAQASGVIPQTGDSSSPALFSILTLGSITALCVLQKRRKSK